jgi:beta-phosphoglucomutase family hydrolase
MDVLTYDISPKVKGLIFDLDGTLINTMPYHFEAWQQTALHFGMDMSKEFMRNFMGASAKVIASELLQLYNKEEILAAEAMIIMKNENFRNVVHKVTPIFEVFDIVKKYHGKIPMAIGTGGSRGSVALSLEQTGVGKYFDVLVCAEDVDNHKPAPDTFQRCAEQLGVNPTDCEVFEDGDLGLQAAEKAGMIATDVRPWYAPTW